MEDNSTYPVYTLQDIQRYVSGNMSAPEMYAMEKAALNDPMLADAIEGFSNADATVVDKDLNDLRAKILGIEGKEKTVVVPIYKKSAVNRWRLLAAAAVLGAIAAGSWWLMQPTQNGKTDIAQATAPAITTDENKHADQIVADTTSAPAAVPELRTQAEKPEKNVTSGLQPLPVAREKNIEITNKENPIANDATVNNNAAAVSKKFDAQTKLAASPVLEQYTRNTTAAPVSNEKKVGGYIFGKIIDDDGKPIPSASIIIGPDKAVMSGKDGSFKFANFTDSILNVSVSMVGYNNATATLVPGKPNNILLPKHESSLNELVVVSSNTMARKKATLGDYTKIKTATNTTNTLPPYPEDGWAHFYETLEEELGVDKSKAQKTLHIKFTVDDNGDPTNFTILESPDEILAKKAIEFIKKGPKWKHFKLNKNAVVKIKVD